MLLCNNFGAVVAIVAHQLLRCNVPCCICRVKSQNVACLSAAKRAPGELTRERQFGEEWRVGAIRGMGWDEHQQPITGSQVMS